MDAEGMRTAEEERTWVAAELPAMTEEQLEDVLWEEFFRGYLRPLWLSQQQQQRRPLPS